MIKGSIPALVTPFKDGVVDLDALKTLVDWHVEQGSHGVLANAGGLYARLAELQFGATEAA